MVKVVKTPAEYKAALAQISSLLSRDPAPGTREAQELETLAVLVQDYEAKAFPINLPDPVEAIRFRMEQQNLSRRDLVPYIGSRARVSEVLSGRRPLTLSMMRALHSGMGIPAKVLLQDKGSVRLDESGVDWQKFPLREMVKRGWIAEEVVDYRSQGESVLRRFFAPLGRSCPTFALLRQSQHVRSARQFDTYALAAWSARVVALADTKTSAPYRQGTVDLAFMTNVARLSVFDEGPRLAGEFLQKHGIRLVIVPHLPGTFLDGAALLTVAHGPVIGMTLRYDRIDNFWFCLMHELAHVARHMEGVKEPFYDDLDVAAGEDPREKEADVMAGEALIPEAAWRNSPASRLRSPEAIQQLANKLGIHSAIVAGRFRHERRNYRVLNQFVGHGQVRQLFAEVKWH